MRLQEVVGRIVNLQEGAELLPQAATVPSTGMPVLRPGEQSRGGLGEELAWSTVLYCANGQRSNRRDPSIRAFIRSGV